MLNVPMFSKIKRSFQVARACRNGVSPHALNAFWKDEEGSATILTLYILMFMLVMAGLGVDTMRHEMERTHLQSTLDAAVLAGAGSPTEKTNEQIREIVEDYFAKNNMSQYLNEISDDDINSTFNSTRVTATADMEINTYLMKLSGVDTLNAAAAATAEITIPKLEISLILDVSGSMSGQKLTDLQAAAKEFVTTILSNSDPGNAVISIVPFSWGVTPNDSIFEALTVNTSHSYSTCLRFDEDDYDDTAINPATSYDQQIYTSWRREVFDENPGVLTDGGSWAYNRSCYTDDYFRILPYSISETDLHAKIDSLQAAGSTSQHLGMKWGAALLDPAFSTVLTQMQAEQTSVDADGNVETYREVDASLSNIPAAYSDVNTQKVIVMMGDGVNDISMFFADNSIYRGPGSDLYEVRTTELEYDYGFPSWDPSTFYYNPANEVHCSKSWFTCVYEEVSQEFRYLHDAGDDRYYNVDTGGYIQDWQFDNLTQDVDFLVEGVDTIPSEEDSSGDDIVVQRTWENAWGFMSPRFYGDVTGNYGPDNEYWNNRQTTSDKDSRMRDICDAVKLHNNVVVYTIGFEIPDGGDAEEQLEKCASGYVEGLGSNFYFPTGRDGISNTFATIASNVQNLRLTQ
ncbi:MAG: VWA domain-containing protein [Pseudomonadota bacterium]